LPDQTEGVGECGAVDEVASELQVKNQLSQIAMGEVVIATRHGVSNSDQLRCGSGEPQRRLHVLVHGVDAAGPRGRRT
jgi:hypothetical protein